MDLAVDSTFSGLSLAATWPDRALAQRPGSSTSPRKIHKATQHEGNLRLETVVGDGMQETRGGFDIAGATIGSILLNEVNRSVRVVDNVDHRHVAVGLRGTTGAGRKYHDVSMYGLGCLEQSRRG